jgi:hypothetical protein
MPLEVTVSLPAQESVDCRKWWRKVLAVWLHASFRTTLAQKCG